MPVQEEVKNVLETVLVPGVKRSLPVMNLVKDVTVVDGKANITLANAALMKESQDWIKEKIIVGVGKLDSVKEVDVSFVEAKPKELNKITSVIAVMSGKGGVGKSLVASLAAVALRRQGYEVGILDADITGPSIPKMFGMDGKPAMGENGILPVLSRSGVEIMSINLLLASEDDAVIWRGPLIGRTITQFWEDVLWGNLDYLIVDLPPGTADAPLTTLQSLPVSGVIIVFTPQDLTAMVVRKAVKMARQMDKDILGVVENMSYLYIAELDKKIELFGESKGDEMAQAAGAPLLGRIPIDPELAKLCDEGDIERYDAAVYNDFAQKLSDALQHGKK
jgi:Mrp family chromosome partitioning ATPase